MRFTRVTSQSAKTITEHFESIAEQNRANGADELNVKMLLDFADIVSRFENCESGSKQVFAKITDLNVTLLAKDDEKSAALAHLSPDMSPSGACLVHVWYPMALSEAPWENAIVSGNARDTEEALQMVAIALKRSGNSPDA